jgi:hypothetical protein
VGFSSEKTRKAIVRTVRSSASRVYAQEDSHGCRDKEESLTRAACGSQQDAHTKNSILILGSHRAGARSL